MKLVSGRDTSKSCSACGHTDDNHRVEPGLYVCEACDTVANADVNGAENIREKVLPSLATDGGDETQSVSSAHQNASRSEDGDRDNGWLAQLAVHLFDRSEGCFAPQEQVANRES